MTMRRERRRSGRKSATTRKKRRKRRRRGKKPVTMRRERRYGVRKMISLVPRLTFSSHTYSGIAKAGPTDIVLVSFPDPVLKGGSGNETAIVCGLAMPLHTYEKEPGDEANK